MQHLVHIQCMAATGPSGEISKLPPSQPWCLANARHHFRDLLCSPKALQLAVVHLPFAEWELRSDQVVAKHSSASEAHEAHSCQVSLE